MDHAEEGLDAFQDTIGCGKWQIIQFIVLTVFYLSWSENLLGFIVLGFTPDFACVPSDSKKNSTVTLNESSQNLTYGQTCEWYNEEQKTSGACSGEYVYAEPKKASIVSEWDLVCGQTYLVDLSQTMFLVGLTIGTIVFTPLADKFGRKKCVLLSHVGFLLVSLGHGLVNNITTFMVARCFLGTFIGGTGMVGWVLTLELFSAKHRTLGALVSNVVWATSTCSVPALAYLMRGQDWRYLQIVLSASSIIIIGQLIFVDESMRWLIANGRTKEATKIMRKAAKMNGITSEKITYVITRYFSDNTDKIEIANGVHVAADVNKDVKEVGEVGADDQDTTNISPMAFIRHPTLRKLFLIMSLAWFSNSLTYMGLYILASTMSGNRYLNLLYSNLAEVAASFLLFLLVLKCGRRKVMVGLHIVAALSLLTAGILSVTTVGNVQKIGVICATILGLCSISGTFNLLFLYTPEVFPTNVRSTALGLISVASRIGGFMSPFAATVAKAVPWVPPTVFGICCLLVGLVSPLLPETRNKGLPQTLEGLDRLYLEDKSKTNKDVKGKGAVPTIHEFISYI